MGKNGNVTNLLSFSHFKHQPKSKNMDESILTEKQLGYLRLAYEVQQIAAPYVNQGGYSLSKIYLNHVVGEIPVCMNTFRKMMKEDVSCFPRLAAAYKKKAHARYLTYLHKQSKKRSKRTEIMSQVMGPIIYHGKKTVLAPQDNNLYLVQFTGKNLI